MAAIEVLNGTGFFNFELLVLEEFKIRGNKVQVFRTLQRFVVLQMVHK